MNKSIPAKTKEHNLAFLFTAYLLTNNQFSWRSLFGVFSLLSSVFFCSNTAAQIVPDNTLGMESSTVKSDNLNGQAIDLIEGGATRGTNLFHSFAEFNIAAEKGAYFANPEGINNILSRVTGSNASQILGTLGVLGNSNLFLLNPNGIFFGENARLNVGGSFFASTADSLLFDNGFEYSGSNPEAPPLLTVNIPIGLGFRDNPGSIVNRSYVKNSTGEFVGLEVVPGQNLTLVGGDIKFEAGEARAKGGNIELGGLSVAGTVGISDDGSLNFPEAVARADISLSNGADVDVSGTGGGNITINSGNLTLEAGEFGSSFIDAGIRADSTSADAQAGNIIIDVAENITLNDSRIINQVDSGGVGNAGNITISTTSLEATNGGFVAASTFGRGNAGQVTIKASDTISVDGEDPSDDETVGGIFSNVSDGAIGNAGGVEITTGNLTLTNAGTIGASTFGRGNAGGIEIITSNLDVANEGEIDNSTFGTGNAGNVTLDVKGAVNITDGNIFSNVEAGGVGEGGTVTINSDSLSVTQGGQIQTLVREKEDNTPAGQGNAGNVLIEVDGEVNILGISNQTGNPSAIFSSLETGTEGSAGNIEVTASSLTLENGAEIDNSTSGQGNAGNISLNITDAVTISGFTIVDEETTRYSNLTNQVFEGAIGNAGNIKIVARSLLLEDGGFLSTSTSGQGNAGNVTLNVDQAVTLSNDGDIFSNVEKGAVATEGEVGTVTINAGSLAIADGDSSINTSTFGTGDAGNVTLNIEGAVDIISGTIFSNVAAGGVGDGGTVTINSDSLSLKDGGQITVSLIEEDRAAQLPGGVGNAGNVTIDVNGEVNISGKDANDNFSAIFSSLGTGAEGSAGNIELTARSLLLEEGGFLSSSTSGQGNAGNVTLNVEGAVTLSNDGDIFSNVQEGAVATEGEVGTVTINAGSLAIADGDSSISTSTFGTGNAGNVTIDVEGAVTLSNDGDIFSNVEEGAVGDSGTVTINSDFLSLTQGSQIQTLVREADENIPAGQGNAGNILIDVEEDVFLSGTSNDESQFPSAIFSSLGTGAEGSAGNIEVTANSLTLENGASIDNSTSGQGNAGNIKIEVEGAVELISGDIFSNVETSGVGDSGTVTINSDFLSLTQGSQIQTLVREADENIPAGQGNAGNILIDVEEDVFLSGTSNDESQFPSAIFSSLGTGAEGSAGKIELLARSLSLEDGGLISTSTFGAGDAGTINITASDIFLDGQDNEGNSSGIASSVVDTAQGNAGGIGIFTTNLSLTDGGQIAVNSEGKGEGGNLLIEADKLNLNNNSEISAATVSGKGGNINLTIAEDIFLKNNSLISARAFENANGGNVTINAEDGSIVAFPNQNNDIVANAQQGNGGNINITTQGIFGLEERSSTPANQTNDIDASSEFGLQGDFSLNTPENDPSRGLVDLPENVVNPEDLISQNACKQGSESKFTVTGRGGLPATPEQIHHSDEVEVGLVEPAIGVAAVSKDLPVAEDSTKIVPAKGWIRNEKGEVFLVGYDPTVSNILPQPENLDLCQPREDD